MKSIETYQMFQRTNTHVAVEEKLSQIQRELLKQQQEIKNIARKLCEIKISQTNNKECNNFKTVTRKISK